MDAMTSKKFGISTVAAIGIVVLALAFASWRAEAAVTVTPAASGTGISVDTAATATTPAWTSLGAITIAENVNTDFAISQTAQTVILTAPTGFEFNSAQTPDVTGASADLSALSMGITSSTLTLTFTSDGTADAVDSVVIGGVTAIQVRPTGGTPVGSVNILRTSGSPGSATVVGITNDTTNFGSLSSVAGTMTKLGVTTEPASATAGAAFGTQPAV